MRDALDGVDGEGGGESRCCGLGLGLEMHSLEHSNGDKSSAFRFWFVKEMRSLDWHGSG